MVKKFGKFYQNSGLTAKIKDSIIKAKKEEKMSKKTSCINKDLKVLCERYKYIPTEYKKYVDIEKLFSPEYTVTWLGREKKSHEKALNFYMFKRKDYSELNEDLNKMATLEKQLELEGIGTAGIRSFNRLTWMDFAKESNGIEGLFEDFDMDLRDFRANLRLNFELNTNAQDKDFECYSYFLKLAAAEEKFEKDPSLLIVKGKTKEHKISLELARHYIAFKYAFECARFFRSRKEGLTAIEFKSVMRNIVDLLAGKSGVVFRNNQAYVHMGEYNSARWLPEIPENILDKLGSLAKWVVEENSLNPIEKAAITQAEFIRIHPYVDGNGRSSRIVTNFVLMYNGLPTIRLRYKDTDKYFAGLNKAIEEHNCDDLIDIFYNAEIESAKNVANCYREIVQKNKGKAK